MAAANNSACGVGVAHDGTFSQGWVLDAVERFTAGVDNGLEHVHSNSHAVVSCYEYDLTSPEVFARTEEVLVNFPFADSCPIEYSSAPCLASDKSGVISKTNDDEQHIWQSTGGGSCIGQKDTEFVHGEMRRGTRTFCHVKEDESAFVTNAGETTPGVEARGGRPTRAYGCATNCCTAPDFTDLSAFRLTADAVNNTLFSEVRDNLSSALTSTWGALSQELRKGKLEQRPFKG